MTITKIRKPGASGVVFVDVIIRGEEYTYMIRPLRYQKSIIYGPYPTKDTILN